MSRPHDDPKGHRFFNTVSNAAEHPRPPRAPTRTCYRFFGRMRMGLLKQRTQYCV